MPRRREDVPESLAPACARCQGDGTIGQTPEGRDIACPACRGDGRLTPEARGRYEARTADRHSTYVGDVVFQPNMPHRELATVPADRLLARPRQVAAGTSGDNGPVNDVAPGRVLVAPVQRGGTTEFVVVGGYETLARETARGSSNIDVEVITNVDGVVPSDARHVAGK